MTHYTYDILNRLASVTDPTGSVTSYGYAGSPGCPTCGGSETIPAAVTDPFGKVTQKSFDKAGRVVGITDPLANLTAIVRDAAGRPATVTDANGNGTNYGYDGLGRITSQTDANGGETDFDYDDKGNLASLSDPNGNVTTFAYDLAGRKIGETRPMGQATTYNYYPNGLLKSVTDAKNQTTTYAYDAASRLTVVTYADGEKDTFGYDAAGNMTSYGKDGVSGTIAYDELNRKTSETVSYGTFSKTFSYTYDARGNKQTFTTPEGTVYTYGYNKNKQPTTISFGTRQVAFDYDHGRLARTIFPGGLTSDYGYNAASWLNNITTKTAAATLASSQYGFDNVGNITGNTTEAGSHSYGYDPTYQVTSATHPRLSAESFGYDKVGNRTGSGYSSDANNELTAGNSATFTYDANGNTVSKADSDGTTTYGYNSADRQETVQLPDGTTATYTYDPFGRRISKNVAGETTYYVYADEGLIGEYDAQGSLQKGYGWKPNGIWGTDPVFMIEGGSYYFYQNDHLGTPQKLVDEGGNVVWSAEYTAFGEAVVDPASTVENNLRFPGQYFDEETNLHYNWQRYYDVEAGRYAQVDPIGFFAGDFNTFRYTRNNSLNYVDPSGEFAWIAAGAVVGAAVNVGVTYISNGGNVSQQQIIAAAVSGAVSGALGAVAGPLGGTLVRGVGMASNSVSAAVGSGIISAVGSAIGQGAANVIDPCHSTSPLNAALYGGLGGGLAKGLFKTTNLNSWKQAIAFGPRTLSGLFGSYNAGRNIISFAASSGVGAASNYPEINPF